MGDWPLFPGLDEPVGEKPPTVVHHGEYQTVHLDGEEAVDVRIVGDDYLCEKHGLGPCPHVRACEYADAGAEPRVFLPSASCERVCPSHRRRRAQEAVMATETAEKKQTTRRGTAAKKDQPAKKEEPTTEPQQERRPFESGSRRTRGSSS